MKLVSKLILVGSPLLFTPALALAQGFALEFEPGSYLEFPHDSVMLTGDTVTIEGWVRPMGVPDGTFPLMNRYKDSQEHKTLAVYADRSLFCLYAGSPWSGSPSACNNTAPGLFPLDQQFHHVAFVRRADGTWEMFLDGTSVLEGGPGTGFSNCCWLTCDVIEAFTTTEVGHAEGTIPWQMATLRVSSSLRYAVDFVPDMAWQSDPDTVLLLQLDEGTGDLVQDTGIAGQVGTLHGSYHWVLLEPELGTTYCTGTVNSTGLAAEIHAYGSEVLADDLLTLRADQVPPLQWGYFLMSSGQGSTPLVSGQGLLCLAAPVIRINEIPSHILFSGWEGYLEAHLDLGALPQGIVFAAGETWHFQGWYRDVVGGNFTSNTTDGVSITWQ